MKVPLIVTVEPTKPAAGEKVGTPGQVAAAVVEYVNAGVESPVGVVHDDIVRPSASRSRDRDFELGVGIDVKARPWSRAPNLTALAGPPFATVWKFVPVTVTSHPRAASLGVTAVTVGIAA